VCRESTSGELVFDVVESVGELVSRPPSPSIVALDMPIGLPAAGARECDRAARTRLGARRSSVFPAPIRPALTAATREQASEITTRIDGRRVGAQAWAIYPKIRAVDAALSEDATKHAAIREVHPELCFWAWNGRRPMAWAKKLPEGLRERALLVEAWLGQGVLEQARGETRKKDLADDDVVDAIAALWTAHRILDGTAETLPASAPRDEIGLRMEIVF
jgi:predicted RNase H-like nuclease